MPNWVINKVTITGIKKDIDKIKKDLFVKFNDFEYEGFNFNDIVPEPKNLIKFNGIKNTSSIICEVISKYKGNKLDKELCNLIKKHHFTEEDIKEGALYYFNKKLLGYENIIDFRNNKWGCKWNHDGIFNFKEISDGFSFMFITLRSTPELIFHALSKKYKNLIFLVEYADKNIGYNCGIYNINYTNGCRFNEITESEARKLWDSE